MELDGMRFNHCSNLISRNLQNDEGFLGLRSLFWTRQATKEWLSSDDEPTVRNLTQD